MVPALVAHAVSTLLTEPGLCCCLGPRCHNKILHSGGFKGQKCICSWFWGVEVQGQGATKLGFWGVPSSRFVPGCFLPLCHVTSYLCAQGGGDRGGGDKRETEISSSFSSKATNTAGLGPPPLVTSFNLNYLLKFYFQIQSFGG